MSTQAEAQNSNFEVPDLDSCSISENKGWPNFRERTCLENESVEHQNVQYQDSLTIEITSQPADSKAMAINSA